MLKVPQALKEQQVHREPQGQQVQALKVLMEHKEMTEPQGLKVQQGLKVVQDQQVQVLKVMTEHKEMMEHKVPMEP